MNKWDACAFKVDEDDLEGRICYGGLYLSSTTDITAFVLVFPPMDADDRYAVLPHFWIPEDNIDLRVRCDHVPYDLWERQGFIQTTEGNVVHYGFIENEGYNPHGCVRGLQRVIDAVSPKTMKRCGELTPRCRCYAKRI